VRPNLIFALSLPMMICSLPRILLVGVFMLAGTSVIAAGSAAKKKESSFGDAVQLAPFVVNGEHLSISIHARTKRDRRYAEKFAEEVVQIAYDTMGNSTGAGLVIIGRNGEPHPLIIFNKFLEMAEAGQLDPVFVARASELTAKIADLKKMARIDEEENQDEAEEEPDSINGEERSDEEAENPPEKKQFKITLEMLLPALPLPLEGLGSKLYQLSWAEGFDDARIEQRLRALTAEDLESDELSKYDWVFYLPPRNAYIGVQKKVIKQAVKQEKIGFFKRAAMKSALVLFKPAIKKAVEGIRKSILFMTVLRVESDYAKEDITYLTGAYLKVLMPDFKFNGGSEQRRALEAIEAQKIKNIEYAKDPYVSPNRLTEYDLAAYATYEGDYLTGNKKTKENFSFKRKGDGYLWQYDDRKGLIIHPAGDQLFVSTDGKMTLEFLVDEKGEVTGVEQRRKRHRVTYSRVSSGS